MIKIKSRNKPEPPRPVMYICNRKKCKPCASGYRYTSDIEYALYDTHTDFDPRKSGIYERVRR